MNSLTLYQVADEYILALDQLRDMDIPEEVFADTLESLSGDMTTKSTNVAMFVRNLQITADAKRAAAKELARQADALEHRSEQILDYLKSNMERCEMTEIACDYFTIKIKKNPAKVEVTGIGPVPVEFMRQPSIPEKVVDKKTLAEFLKTAGNQSYAKLTNSTRITIT